MNRRVFLGTLTGGLLGARLTAGAQQAGKVPLCPRVRDGQRVLCMADWTRREKPRSEQDGPHAGGSRGKHSRYFFRTATGESGVAVGDQVYHPGPDGTGGRGGGRDHQNVSFGSNIVWTSDLLVNPPVWKHNGFCQAPGTAMPGNPDNCAVTYDEEYDVLVVIPGAMGNEPPFTGQPNASRCVDAAGNPYVEEFRDAALYDFTKPSDRRWRRAPFAPPPWRGSASMENVERYQGDLGMTYGVYDRVSKRHIYLARFSGQAEVLLLDLRTNSWERVDLNQSLPSTGANKVNRSQSAIDVVGRCVYVLSFDYQTSGSVERWPNGHIKRYLLKYHIDQKKIVGAFLLPDTYRGAEDQTIESWMVFDSRRRVLVMPDLSFNGPDAHINNVTGQRDDPFHIDTELGTAPGIQFYGGMLTHLIEFRVDAKAFDDVPAPHPPVPVPRGTPFPFGVDAAHPYITGNLFGFDAKIGKMVIYGRDSGLNSNAPGGQTGTWWLYGPDTAP